MTSYSINYTINNQEHDTMIEAKNIKNAKAKIGKKHGFKDGRKVKVNKVIVLGYF